MRRPRLPRLRRRRARSRPRGRWRPVVVLVLTAFSLSALAGGWLWLRDSSLVAVRHVKIAGLTAHDAPAIRAALRGAARSMTTLHVRRGELRDAVVAYPIVKALSVQTDFPHGLRIRVIQNVAVAVIDSGGTTVPAAADGALLRDQTAGGRLPHVAVDALPTGPRVRDRRALGLLALAGAAPSALRPLIERIRRGDEGLLAELHGGLKLIFGSRGEAAAKWAAAARVIADSSSAGAGYIDLRVPGRPVAGGFSAGGGAAASGATSAAGQSAGTQGAGVTPAAPSAPPTAPTGTGTGA